MVANLNGNHWALLVETQGTVYFLDTIEEGRRDRAIDAFQVYQCVWQESRDEVDNLALKVVSLSTQRGGWECGLLVATI